MLVRLHARSVTSQDSAATVTWPDSSLQALCRVATQSVLTATPKATLNPTL